MLNSKLLTSTEVQELAKKCLKEKWDVLKLSTELAKNYTAEERREIMDYLPLIQRAQEKFNTHHFLLCDKLALEQSTAYDISMWKSSLWPSSGNVHDLCCGMGGDSFFIPENLFITGVDLSEDRLEMYKYNMECFQKKFSTLQGDVRNILETHPLEKADYFSIDPARRKEVGENQRNFNHLTPSLEEVLTLAKNYKGGMIKLPPGYPTEEIPKEAEIIYLGSKQDCRECLVLLGELAKNPGKTRAVLLQKDKVLEYVSEISQEEANFFLSEGPVKKYLTEPCPLFVRSKLFNQFAKQWNGTVLSQGIAYISTDSPIQMEGFSCFEILDYVPLGTAAVKNMLKKFNVGKITLKKRGVEIIPEEEIKRLKVKGKNEGVLIYTRLAGEKIALLAKRIF